MNLIPTFCDFLGLKIGEKFKLKNIDYNGKIFRFTRNSIEFKTDSSDWQECGYWAYKAMITGEDFEIIKLPWVPKEGERYWCVRFSYNSGIYVTDRPWEETVDVCWFDKCCKNRFRTKEEAEMHKYEIYEKLTGRKWEEKDG